MALILGIETGTDICSVSLSEGGRLIDVRGSAEGNDHARRLAPLIDEVLAGNGRKPTDLGAVAVGSGPGSYTGLRIGVSTAKGLCYGLGIPLIGVGSLYSLASVALGSHAFPAGSLLCPMIDARRMEVYAQVFDTSLEARSDIGAHIIDSESFGEFIDRSERFVIFGNGAAKCRDLLRSPKVEYIEILPSAAGLVTAAWEKYRAGRFEDTAYFEPFYLKDFIVTASRKPLL